MSNSIAGQLDPTRILFDLQQGNEIAQSFSGCLEPEEIARRVTDGLVEKFNCAFARLWLLEPDQATLKLIASSGMYTRTDGFFARVPMGAYKVGKIAQNRVSFLSNDLAAETWVGNREWAVANQVRGFAGYPLAVKEKVVGVLAAFSHQSMEPEFLEALQTLCTMATIALDTASHYQKEQQFWRSSSRSTFSHLSLSDQLASLLSSTRLTLVGTEQPLTLPIAYVFLRAAEILNQLGCTYGRLIYSAETVSLEATVPTPTLITSDLEQWLNPVLHELSFTVSCLGGLLQTQTSAHQKAIQVVLSLPHARNQLHEKVQIRCHSPVLHLAFTQLAILAGLTVCQEANNRVPLLTDDILQVSAGRQIIWIHQGIQTVPKGIKAKVDLSVDPAQLKEAVTAARQGKLWGVDSEVQTQQVLSERELEILTLLTQGLRDRDIADRLVISESTVKFHMNNTLSKLKARTRYQAIYEAIEQGWI
ncbi:MAG TPA: LuxR C-terminal-related transcriptional regulator [Trichocoleus sp.]|jgi:DNA-binding NarL/FixJ family response regulator